LYIPEIKQNIIIFTALPFLDMVPSPCYDGSLSQKFTSVW